MSSSDAVSETNATERVPEIPDAVASAMEAAAPSTARRFGSGNFSIIAGGISLFRAVRSYRKGDRKRALLRAAVGLFWVGVAVVQRRRRQADAAPDPSEVVDTSPDVEDAVEPGGRDADHAAGSEVVDTTDADIEESDTAPEEDVSPEVEREVEGGDADQRDVVEGTDVEDVTDADAGAETGENSDGENSDEY